MLSDKTLHENIECILNTGQIQNFIIENDNSNIDNLRKFHNYIKKQLIIQNSKNINANNLLDIASGRGGDMFKWRTAGLQSVFAFDNHKESVEISKDRLKEQLLFENKELLKLENKQKYIQKTKNNPNFKLYDLKNYKKLPNIKYFNLNILQSNIIQKINNLDNNEKYDIISCQFAFHYFSKNIETLNQILSIISSKLKPGGVFVGTATDGDKIKKILKINDVDIPLLTLLNVNEYSYIFNIKSKNSVRKTYFELQGESLEYYLQKKQLITIAKKYNLELIEIKTFNEWYDKSFNLSPYEMIISFLNFSFVFKKKI